MAVISLETDKIFPVLGGTLSAIEARVIKRAIAGELRLTPGVDRELPKRVTLVPEVSAKMVDLGGAGIPYGVRAKRALTVFH